MKILNKNDYQEILSWEHRHARPLELALWKFYNEDGSLDEIVKELEYYQNEDGGFGMGVEPDCWNPESAPYTTLTAIGILRKTGFMEKAGSGHPMVQGIFRYLESGVYTEGEEWSFSIPSNDEYPRAPWWTYNKEVNKVQNLGITAGLCGFILRYADREKELFHRACAYTRAILEKAAAVEDFGEMGAGGVCLLVGDIMQSGLSSSFSCSGIMEKMANE